jgi:hypothetical protein
MTCDFADFGDLWTLPHCRPVVRPYAAHFSQFTLSNLHNSLFSHHATESKSVRS